MGTGQNNNNLNNRNNNGKNHPAKKRHKVKVPGAVIAIYILMAALVLAICALVFIITLNATGWNGENRNDTSENVSENSSVPSEIILTNSSADSSDTSSSDSSSFEFYPGDTDNSSSDDSEVPQGMGEASGAVDLLSTEYDDEFFENDLFIGDSIFTGLYLYGYLDMKNVAAAVGYTPNDAMYKTYSQSYGGSASDYAAEMQPKRIFIMLGSNTMGSGTNYDTVISQYSTLLSTLKVDCSDSDICVISIPPVTSDSSAAASSKISNSDIDSVNVRLKSMADSAKVGYFDLNAMLSDESGYFIEDYAEMDGLHFKGVTYKVMLSALQKIMSTE